MSFRRQVQHGVDGWVLEDMEWDPETGIAFFEYSNRNGEPNVLEVRTQSQHAARSTGQWYYPSRGNVSFE